METKIKLEPGQYYHLRNRGNNRESLFLEERNYFYFLFLWKRHTQLIMDTLAYSLHDNHFDFIVKIRDPGWLEEVIVHSQSRLSPSNFISQQLSNFFNAYAKAFNKVYARCGSLFEERFKRELLPCGEEICEAIRLIHEKGRAEGGRFNSYQKLMSGKKSFLRRDQVIGLFGGKENFIQYHECGGKGGVEVKEETSQVLKDL